MSTETTTPAVSGSQATKDRSRMVRRSVTAVAGFVAGIIGILAAAPAAFAMRVVTPDGGPGTHTSAAAAPSGLAAWEIALIVAAALALVSLFAFAAVKVRSRVPHVGGATA
jgi:hypothetical protein